MPTKNYLSDLPATDDALGRSQFANSLAQALLANNSNAGFVIGIEGGWGSGKSSIIGFAKKFLSEAKTDQEPSIIIEFNPWLVSNTGALVEALIGQIAASIGANVGTTQEGIKTGAKLLRYVSLLRHLKYLKYVPALSWAGNAAEDVGIAAESVAGAAKETQEVLGEVQGLLPVFDVFKRKSEVCDALRDLNRSIVVIVDDIDRLPPEEIRLVVQAIKAVGDFPRTTYLLAYDRAVVAKALGVGDEVAGLAYLEKIVQVAYPIPPLFRYQIRKFVSTRVYELLQMLEINLRPFEQEEVESSINLISKLARHPRDVIRLLNRLILSLPTTHTEVNSVDVLVFEALSQRCPSIREMIHSCPEDFVGQPFRGDLDASDPFSWMDWVDGEEEKTPAWEKHLPLDKFDRRVVADACIFLFGDRVRKIGEVPEDSLRLADPDRLARYFRMSSLENVPEASDTHRMLRNPTELASSLEGVDEDELRFQLEWIFNYLPSCDSPDVSGCIGVLIGEANSRLGQGLLSDQASSDFEKLVERLIFFCIPDQRAIIFLNVVDLAPLAIAEHVLLRAAAEQGKWIIRREMRKAVGDRFVEDEVVVDTAIVKWSRRVDESYSNDRLSLESNINSVLYRYAQLNCDYTSAYNMARGFCSTDEGLGKFLSGLDEANPLNILDKLGLVDDAKALADRINSSSISKRYEWLSRWLVDGGNSKKIAAQAKNQLEAEIHPAEK